MKFSQKIKKNRIKIVYLCTLSLFFVVFLTLALANFEIKRINAKTQLKEVPLEFFAQEYPSLERMYEPFVSANGVVVMDADSQVVLYGKNPNLRFSPASTTKIMSALVALDYFSPSDIIKVNEPIFIEGVVIKLSQGEEFRFEDLLYAMMLPSANDAAKTIAAAYPGGEEAFVNRMNEKAVELGLKNTFYADPAGLLDTKDYTTPLELAKLSSFAMRSPDFARIVSTKKRTITNLSGKEYDLENLNILLSVPGVNGVKTGYTQEAGQVLVTSRILPGTDKDVIIVVMQSEDRFADSQTLLNFLDGNITYRSIHQ
jgi:serine-type D-Ala-D-Ala carboxypeptidase (penicillin-binding protein 5/6)